MVKKEKNEARKGLTLGDHEVNCLVRVQGSIRVGADITKTVPARIDWTGIACLALSKLNGVTMESIVQEYLNSDDFSADVKDMKKRGEDAIETLKATTVKTTNGQVTTKLSYESVELPDMVV